MKRKTRAMLRRFLAGLLAVLMILPTGMGIQNSFAASTVAGMELSPVLNSAGYRYLLVGESYDFNIKNKIPGSVYTWKSSNTKIATVDKKGEVTAKSAGTAKITCDIKAKEKSYFLTAEVYVKKSIKNPASGVKIINKVDTIAIGEKYNLNKSYVPEKAADYINWTSSNTNIATVDKNGFVTGIKTGEVTITAATLSKKVKDSVKITVTDTAIVSDQSQLEKALSSGKASNIKIKTDKEVEFNIPEGNYANQKLIVDAPQSSVNNHGVFREVSILAIKPDTWHEYANGNNIIIEAANSRIIIEASASAEVHISKTDANTVFEIKGGLNLYIEASGNIDIKGASGIVPNITISNKGSVIKTELALNIQADQQATIELNSAEASKTTIKTDSKDNIPIVKGSGNITVIVNGVSQTVGSNQGNTNNTPTSVPTTVPTAVPTPTTAPTPSAGPSPTPVIPDKVTAVFGSPHIDGTIDDCWKTAEVIKPDIYSAASDVKVKHRIMWDDNALYFLTEVQDSNLDKTNTTTYQQDSVEYFLDELYDKASGYQPDDMHFRVNFDNMRSTDSGDSKRFYTRTQLTKDASGATTGYIAEACIVWADNTVPANGLEMGVDLQINEAKSGSRAATITVFDTTGNAFQYPNVFGKLVLAGKDDGAVSGVNPYPLLTLIDTVKNMYLDAYVNKEVVNAPLEAAESIAAKTDATQQQLDAAYAALLAAVNILDDGSGYTKASALPEQPMPDPFTFLDGSKVTTLADWEARQQEISGLYQYYMYGMKRSGENVRYEFVDSYKTMVFDYATWTMVEKTVTPGPDQKFVKVFVEKDGKEVSFMTTATFPSTTSKDAEGKDVVAIADPIHDGGYPVLVSIGSLGASQKKYLNDNGYAVIEFTYTDIASDDANHNGIFYQLYPYGKTYDQQTGALMAWAWGVSKVIDAVVADAAGANAMRIDPDNTMVTGVSRCGKAAAIAGAFDSRIRVTVPASSGTSGVASFRYSSAGKVYDYSSLEKEEFIDFSGEASGTAKWQSYQDHPLYTVGSNEQLSNSQGAPHWFNDNFLQFTSANQLPFDQHLLVALAADTDRYYFITGEVDGGDWINNAGMYASYLAAQNVYDSLGVSDNLAIHLHSTGHALTLEDTKYLVEFCNQKLYGQTDGKKDLNHVKTSIYELPVNYDPYFDVLKNMNGPDFVIIPDKVTAAFGSPHIDGVIDDCWKTAEVIKPDIYSAASDVKVKHRIMWDDNALYFLTEVQDSNLDKTNTTTYQQDSVEYFLDELYDKASGYQPDDMHFRVNFDNMRSTDSGDSKRFYTRTQLTKDASGATTGYIAEACIVWADNTVPANGLEMGVDLQINEAKSGSRAATITVFDTTGNAFQYPNVFGKLVLAGKDDGAVSGVNPYPLLTLIDTVKNMYLDAYVNKEVVNAPLEAAESIAAKTDATQQQLDAAYAALLAAVNILDDGSGYTKASALPEQPMPDPFTFLDGSKVTTLADWEARQQEISGLYQYYMYGMKRSGENVRYEFVDSYKTMVFDYATWTMVEKTVTPGPDQKFVKVFVEKDGKEVSFMTTATFPSTTSKDAEGKDVVAIADPIHDGGYPVLVSIGSLGASQKKYLNDNGYAVIEFTYTDIASDDANHNGIFYQLYPYGKTYDQQTGALMAWAWGVSKVIDAVVADAAGANAMRIDPDNTMVTGVSRCGKAAAIAGAFDSRIRVTVPASSGTSGVASFRYSSAGKVYDYSSLEKEEFIDFSGEASGTAKWQSYQDHPLYTVGSNEQLSNSQGAPHWFNDNFLQFTSANQLPFDQHLLVALAADTDRYYFITGEVDGGDWINNAGMYASYLAAQNVYDSLGVSDNLAIHLHSTGHALTLEDTKYLVEFCNQKLYGQTDGRKDLNHVKTSIYELPVNYDPYFDVLKNMDGPDFAGNTLYSETFDNGIGNYVTSVSGAALSIRTIDGNNMLNVVPAGGFVAIPLSVSGSAVSISGSALSVSGSAISVSGPAISVSGSAVSVSVSMMYDEDTTANVIYQMGLIEASDAGLQDVILKTVVEPAAGQFKGGWITLTATFTLTDKDAILYLKGFNVSSYNIDNIIIRKQ